MASLLRRLGTSGSLSARQVYKAASAANQVVADVETTILPPSSIPGPASFPIFGSIPSMMLYPEFRKGQLHRVWQRMSEEYGPVLVLKLPMWDQPCVIISNPRDKEAVLKATRDNPIRVSLTSLKRVRDETVDDFFNKRGGLLTEQEEEWWRVRRAVQTPMMKIKNVEAYIPAMDEVALDFMDRIAVLQELHGEMPKDFLEELYKWSLESVSVVSFSRRMGCLDPDLPANSKQARIIKVVQSLFKTLMECEFGSGFYRFFDTPSYKTLKKMHQELLEVALENIALTEAELATRRSESHEEPELTLMDQLLLSPTLTKKDVVTLILDMVFAGIDTTSHTLAFTLYLLAKNPEAQRKLQMEMDRVLGDDPGPITPAHLAKLSYTKAVIKEALRMFPVAAGTLRNLTKDVVLSGYHVPKGYSVIMINDYDTMPNSSFPRAREFLPDRWLRGNPLAPASPYASLPFGAGTRMCVGRRIAEQEMYIFLARVMYRYNITYDYEDMDATMQLVLKPTEPLQFAFTQRR